MLCDVSLGVIMLSVIMLSVIMLIFAILSVDMLSVITQNVIILSVAAAFELIKQRRLLKFASSFVNLNLVLSNFLRS